MLSWGSQWIQQASLGWVVYEITGSGSLLGAVLGARAIPMLLLTPFSGLAADRYDRRRLLQAGQVLAAAVALSFGAALALGLVSVWMLFAFTMLMGAANVMDRPARLTTAFDLVPRDMAMKAVALNTIGFSFMRIIGPAVAGFLIAWFGAAGSFLIQGVLYAASALMVLAVAFPPRRPVAAQRSALADILEGLRYAVTDPTMRLLLVIGLIPFLLLIPVWGALFPIYVKDEFGAGAEGLGILLTAIGVGGTVGGFIANALSRARRQGRIQAFWILVMALAIFGVSVSPSLGVAVIFAFFGGMGEMAHTASNMAMMQLVAPEALRGRVASLIMLYPAFISMGALVAGPLADLLGARAASAALAAAGLLITVFLYATSPRLRELRLK